MTIHLSSSPSSVTGPAALALALCCAAVPARAGAGHDHDHGSEAAAAPAATGLPRFSAVSDHFELVCVLDGRQLTLFLDHFADNTPVRGAQIALDIAGTRFTAQPQDGDRYGVTLAAAPAPGELAITATISAGAVSDRLAAELDLHGNTGAGDHGDHDHDHDEGHGLAWPPSRGALAGGLLAVAALAVAALAVAVWRWRAGRAARTGAAA